MSLSVSATLRSPTILHFEVDRGLSAEKCAKRYGSGIAG